MKHPRQPSSWRRRIAAWLCGVGSLLVPGCSSTTVPATGDLRKDLHHEDPRFRIDAAALAASEGRADLVPDLVENLEDRDGAVRLFTIAALRELTGEDFGYKPYGMPDERFAAVTRWKAWLRTRPGTGGGAAEPGGGSRAPAEEGGDG